LKYNDIDTVNPFAAPSAVQQNVMKIV